MNHFTPVQAAYLAGIVDGEGCIFVSRYDRKDGRQTEYGLIVSIAQSNLAFIDYLHDLIGAGFTREVKNKTAAHHMDRYDLRITGKQAGEFLQAILPHLIIKKDQARLAIDLVNAMHQGSSATPQLLAQRESIFRLIKAMKKSPGIFIEGD